MATGHSSIVDNGGAPISLSQYDSGNATKRQSTWHRVTSIYSTSSRQKEDPDDSLDIWDKNDDDFQREIARESSERAAWDERASTPSVEEVRSPTDTRTGFIQSSDALPMAPSSPYAATFSSPKAQWQRTPLPHAVPVRRPSSATGTSIFSSPIYSLVSSSEGGSALTFPSPGSSSAEMRKGNRLSGTQAQFLGPSASSSREASPTHTNFAAAAATDAVKEPSKNVQLAGWTQENIDDPASHQPGRKSLATGRSDVRSSPSRSYLFIDQPTTIVSGVSSTSALDQPIGLLPGKRSKRALTAAEKIRDEAMSSLNQTGGAEGVNASRSVQTIDNASTIPSSKSSNTVRRQEGQLVEAGVMSSLKKKLFIRRKPSGSTINNEKNASSKSASANGLLGSGRFSRSTLALDDDSASTSHGVQLKRSPSSLVSPAKSYGTSKSSPPLHTAQAQWYRYNEEMTGSVGASHKNAANWSPNSRRTEFFPTSGNVPGAPSEEHGDRGRERVAEQHATDVERKSFTADGSDSAQFGDARRRNKRTSISLSSQKGVLPPPRPARTEGDQILGRSASLTNASASPRLSLESSFNAAHDRRWSAVGPTFLQSARRGSDVLSLSGHRLRRGSDAHGSLPSDWKKSPTTSHPRTSIFSVHDDHKAWDEEDTMNKQRAVPPGAIISKPAAPIESLNKVDNESSELGFDQMAEDPYADRTVIPFNTLNNFSPASDAFTTQSSSIDRTSTGSALSGRMPYTSVGYESDPIGGVEMRPSRSTNDLVKDRKQDWRSASSSNLAVSNVNNLYHTSKRPTFGLDLQADAAAAFDSIPLPATPEQRSRSRLSSLTGTNFSSNDILGDAATTHGLKLDRMEGRASIGEESVAPHALCLPDDLPADVEDFEDLLDAENDEKEEEERRKGDETARPAPLLEVQPPSGTNTSDSQQSSVDEVELLEDDVAYSGKLSAPASPIMANENDSSISDSGRPEVDLSAYRFPPASAGLKSSSSGNMNDREQTTAASLSLSRPLSHTSVCSNSSASIANVAAHLRRPSSSASFV